LSTNRGFTIVEIVVAIVILSVGLLGLVTTAALVSRMIAQGQRYSMATALANQRFEKLSALRTFGGGCTSLTSGADTVGRIVVSWTVTTVNAGAGAQIVMTVTSPTGRGTHTDNFTSTVACL
jgi:prepilin-type N-terminal cleavage/methylation domain-containing protein